MVKFYKKRGKAIWKRKFISQRKNGQNAKRWLIPMNAEKPIVKRRKTGKEERNE